MAEIHDPDNKLSPEEKLYIIRRHRYDELTWMLYQFSVITQVHYHNVWNNAK